MNLDTWIDFFQIVKALFIFLDSLSVIHIFFLSAKQTTAGKGRD